jgi:hypothetical protein
MREPGARLHEMLAVVEEEQELHRAQLVEEPGERSDIGPVEESERSGDRGRQERRIRQRDQVDEPDTAAPGAHLARRDLQRQPRLARAAHTGQRDQALLPQQPLEVRELAAAADEARHRCGKVVPRLRRRCGGDLLAQDGALEHAELLARLQPKFLGQQPACTSIGGERVRLALAPVERNHQLPPEPFAQRMLRDEALELGDELRVVAESEPGFDVLLLADQAKLV